MKTITEFAILLVCTCAYADLSAADLSESPDAGMRKRTTTGSSADFSAENAKSVMAGNANGSVRERIKRYSNPGSVTPQRTKERTERDEEVERVVSSRDASPSSQSESPQPNEEQIEKARRLSATPAMPSAKTKEIRLRDLQKQYNKLGCCARWTYPNSWRLHSQIKALKEELKTEN